MLSSTNLLDPPNPCASKRDVVTVCHPVWRLDAGGLEHQLLLALERLPSEKFHHVLIVRGMEAHEEMPQELGENITLIRQDGSAKDGRSALELAAILREQRVDILHIRGLSMLADGLIAANLYGHAKTAFSFHGFESAPEAMVGPRRMVWRSAITECDDRWAVSRSAGEELTRVFDLPSTLFETLPNGVDCERFVPAANKQAIRSRLGLQSSNQTVLSLGNLKPIKGHLILLKAAAWLKRSIPGVTMILVGRDYLDGELQRYATTHLSGMDIRFVGHQDDCLPWYQAADVFVLPSLFEGMSNSLLEAMACELPIVASAVGGNLDCLEPNVSGRLVPAGDAEALADALHDLLADRDAAHAMGTQARATAQRKFSITSLMAQLADRYQCLASGRLG